MTPEAGVFLAQARRCLDAAERIAAADVPRVAAREAYMAAFHAAQGILFERTGRVHKTHSGVHAAFGRLAKAEPMLGVDLGRFLAQSYDLKDAADYRLAPMITADMAEEAIRKAKHFVARVEAVLGGEDDAGR